MCKTVGLLIIGNEVLDGRASDTNSHYLAKRLAEIGCPLAHVL